MNETPSTYQSWEELATDLDFIAWVKTGSDRFSEWKDRVPVSFVEDWVKDASSVVEVMEFEDLNPSIVTKKKMWSEINSSITLEKNNVRKINWGAWSAAASLLLFAAVGWLIWSTPNKTSLTTEVAEQKIEVLPDQSRVTLNAESQISYIESEWESDRHLSLRGEAFFEVEKGSNFTVSTPSGEVTVLGTSFNVLSRKDLLEVHCYTGRVAVSTQSSEVTLLPGDWTRLQGDILNTHKFVPDTERLWINGYFTFENRSIRKVFDELQRQYSVEIDDSALTQTYSYTGFFTSGDLNKALEAVCWPLRLGFEVKGDKVTIFEE